MVTAFAAGPSARAGFGGCGANPENVGGAENDEWGGAVLVCMDADLSHPPEQIAELVEAVDGGGANFVIGSRYVAGGGTDDESEFLRWLNSKVAT